MCRVAAGARRRTRLESHRRKAPARRSRQRQCTPAPRAAGRAASGSATARRCPARAARAPASASPRGTRSPSSDQPRVMGLSRGVPLLRAPTWALEAVARQGRSRTCARWGALPPLVGPLHGQVGPLHPPPLPALPPPSSLLPPLPPLARPPARPPPSALPPSPAGSVLIAEGCPARLRRRVRREPAPLPWFLALDRTCTRPSRQSQ
mmetsp:Transcript_22909/g.55158  ORF Transcript_22909/g.55158 Transcript_22909/m.55158 type:complete len:207 (-) Transcript_22909:110-730(-)